MIAPPNAPVFDDDWREWLFSHVLEGTPFTAIAAVMVREGFSERFAAEALADAQGEPAVHAALRIARAKKKLDSHLAAQAQLFMQSGFALERKRVSPDDFYERYFFANRPVIVPGLMDDWPAMERWTPTYFRERFGDVEIEITADREADPRFEDNFVHHRRYVRFSDFIVGLESGPSNDRYLVGKNNALAHPSLAVLRNDFASPAGFLDGRTVLDPYVKLWFGPSGTVTPLHHDATNIFFGQVYGRKLVRLIPPCFINDLYNDRSCFSAVDLDDVDLERFPLMRDVTVLEAILEPGDFLLIPVGWWHWVRSLDVSISLSFQNFLFNGPIVVWHHSF